MRGDGSRLQLRLILVDVNTGVVVRGIELAIIGADWIEPLEGFEDGGFPSLILAD